MDSYTVGDVIWVVGRERPGLRVFQVVEEVTKKTLKGEVTTYMVSAPSNKQEKKINLSKIDGQIFTSSDSAKKAMQAHAENAINQMFQHTEKLINSYFQPSTELVMEPDVPKLPSEEGYEKIVLENGTVARVKISDNL